MKKYSSVFYLFVRSSFYKVLGILLLMTAAEAGLFYWRFHTAMTAFDAESVRQFRIRNRC